MTDFALDGRRNIYARLSGFYYIYFFGMGALYPLLSVYFKDKGLTGSQLGLIMSVGPIVSIITQPIWGMLCDRYRIEKKVLFITLISAGVISLFFPISQSFLIFLMLIGLMNVFQSAVVPITDNISMNFVQRYGGQYGDIRLWGSIGFAVAVWVAGLLSDHFHSDIIFYLYTVSLFIAATLTKRMSEDENSQFSVNVFKEMKKLLTVPSFSLFLLGTFLLFGTMNANNTYFGIFYQSIGGTKTGIGLAFLLAAGSEVPFMRWSGKLITKFGLLPVMIFSAVVTVIRWFFYSLGPSVFWVIVTTFVQGLSIGLFLATAVQFVKTKAEADVQVTAMSLYGSFGLGLGSFVSSMIGGWIYEHFGILNTYLYMAIASFLAILIFLVIWVIEREGHPNSKMIRG
ncbi:MFS transporter [Tepidibacillus fermentans]|uniref:PPP family 3-phenylpropionic acid transporter n=1 Tax=Tepidibacillus fermentans TaxID=1281767 RepID=A0A4R3KGW2_9BACI|nr:major facilitator superfamily domain-containing protein 6 [Tepidibacillus fermentans]TCS82490.1 PPP family 3-phenylpropionic acid transporter [Tepidibacillus fermentans]